MGSISAWQEICVRLRKRIGPSAFEAWFRNLTAHEDGRTLVLVCTDPFSMNWIRSHYGAPLAEAAAPDFQEVRCELVAGRPDSPQTGRIQPVESSAPVARPTGLPDPIQSQTQGAFSFENLIVGPHNALAVEAARAIARGQNAGLSPLVLTGETGGGKSHLCRSIERANPAGTLYCSSEEFTSEVTHGLRSGQMDRVRHRYRRSLNVLILEDVQFLPGKRATQIELFHTLDHLVQHGKTVVLSADRPPSEIDGLDGKLASRMSGGLIARISAPDIDTRRRILAEKAANGGVRIPSECLDVLAGRSVPSVRELLSGLNQVVARASLLHCRVDLKLVRETLSDVDLPGRAYSVPEIMEITARAYSLQTEDLWGPSRQRVVARARQFAMYLCRCYTSASLKQIGRAFRRDHTSVMHSIRVVERRNLEQAQHRYEFEALAVRLGPLPKARP